MAFTEIPFEGSDRVLLPVGLDIDGTRYREVYIDELCGIDDFNMADKKLGNNSAKASTVVLARCIQEITGLIPRKKNSESKLEIDVLRRMTSIDRDYLLARIYYLSGREMSSIVGICPRCNSVWEEVISLQDLPVYAWPEDKPLHVSFELPAGMKDPKTGEIQKKGSFRFPTGRDQELMASIENSSQAVDSLFSACIFGLGTLEKVDSESVKRLKHRDRLALLEVIQHEFPGLRQWKEVTCGCGRDFEIRLDLTSFFGSQSRKKTNS